MTRKQFKKAKELLEEIDAKYMYLFNRTNRGDFFEEHMIKEIKELEKEFEEL